MQSTAEGSMLKILFGTTKGSGAAMVMFILGILGTAICLVFGRYLEKYKYVE